MLRDHGYFVYILSSKSRTLYIGVTNSLLARVAQHCSGELGGFTSKYKVNRLVHFERFQYIGNAIAREKELKGWLRSKKISLIEQENPTWEDLSLKFLAAPVEKQVLRAAQDDKLNS